MMTAGRGGATLVVTTALLLGLASGCGSSTSPTSEPTSTAAATPPAGTSSAPSSTATSAAPSSIATSVPPASVPPPTATGEPTPVPEQPVQTTRARLDKDQGLGNGVQVAVSKIEAVKGVARGPGEVAGDALRVTVTVDNQTAEALSMDLAVVNLSYGRDKTPASTLSGPGVRPFAASIKAGSTGSGRYVFAVPKDDRDTVSVEFSYTTAAPTVVFTGKPDV